MEAIRHPGTTPDAPEQGDSALVARVTEGDTGALRELYDRRLRAQIHPQW